MTATATDTATVYISVALAARMVGVSTARVYQRIDPNGEGTRIPAITEQRATRDGRPMVPRFRLDLRDVLTWRAERLAQGLDVGPVPEGYTPEVTPAIGLPTARPF